MFDFLSHVPSGLFDFEIGVQSTHQPTLTAVARSSRWDKLSANIVRLQKMGNIHLHVDLIAGLPEESYDDFARSFNDVFMLKAHVIQLGFLKLLKGSPLRDRAGDYNMAYQQIAPYEILSHHKMSFADIDLLHYNEEMVQRYPNSHRFTNTMEFIIERVSGDAFRFFESLAKYWLQAQHHRSPHSREVEYLS
jgi:coproporphyrinogen III oxidase-like Fe-S oxidoreductase